MKRTLSMLLVSVLTLVACNGVGNAEVVEVPVVDSVIPMEKVKVVLPQAGDVALVEDYCTACHSLRYIEMQPPMTHKSWKKLVDKMIHVYGAPVRDSVTANAIVNYLAAIKYKADP